MVGDGGNGFILNVGGAAEAFDNTGGYGGKGIVVFELTLKKCHSTRYFGSLARLISTSL